MLKSKLSTFLTTAVRPGATNADDKAGKLSRKRKARWHFMFRLVRIFQCNSLLQPVRIKCKVCRLRRYRVLEYSVLIGRSIRLSIDVGILPIVDLQPSLLRVRHQYFDIQSASKSARLSGLSVDFKFKKR